MSERFLPENAFGERSALEELLVAALTLCMQNHELAAADHILDALRELSSDDDEASGDEDGRAGFR